MKTHLLTAPIGLLLCASCTSQLPLGSPGHVLVIAHRGDSKVAPENTLSAFRSALDTGAAYVELDARVSADGTLYVLHDETLDRTTDATEVLRREKILIRQTPDATISRLDAGKWFEPKFARQRVPTLAEALDVIQARSHTLLEHKEGSPEAYVHLLREKGLVGRLMVQSFDWKFLRRVHELEPRQPLGALGHKELTEDRLAEIAATGACVVAWKYTDLTAPMVADLHRRGYKVWTYTSDEPAEWQRLRDLGVDGIITDCPAQLARMLRNGALKPST